MIHGIFSGEALALQGTERDQAILAAALPRSLAGTFLCRNWHLSILLLQKLPSEKETRRAG